MTMTTTTRDYETRIRDLENSLPDKLSDLLDVAMRELERVEADPAYRVDMSRWHNPVSGLCSVCLAGAVLTRALSPDEIFNFSEENAEMTKKIVAIDFARSGSVGTALWMIGQACADDREFLLARRITPYAVSPAQFRLQMRDLIRDLRGLDL